MAKKTITIQLPEEQLVEVAKYIEKQKKKLKVKRLPFQVALCTLIDIGLNFEE